MNDQKIEKCSFAQPGTYGHECGKPAVVKTKLAAVLALALMGLAFRLGQLSAEAPVELSPAWATPHVKPGNDWYNYALPFEMGGERYLAVFSHRTESISPISGWAVKMDGKDPDAERAKADWLMEHFLTSPEPVNAPRPTKDDLAQFDKEGRP